jgi:hypothetical protein
MKKFVLIAAGLSLAFAAGAQKSQIRNARNYLGEKEYEKAKASIEAAVMDESTKDDPYAWFTRGLVYLAIQQLPENEAKDLYNEAGKSFKKAAALKSDYETADLNNKLYAVSIYNFNAGLNAFDKQGYDKAFTSFGEVADIRNLEGGKRFGGKSWAKFDTMARQAALYQAYSSYYANKYDEALPLLLKAKDDAAVRTINIYQMLGDIYEAKGDDAGFSTVLDEGKKTYPNDKTLVNRELNYYIKKGKSEDLVKRLETAIAADPNNSDLLFTLGIAYDNIANPKDKDGKDLPKPANFNDVFTKAEQAYMNVLKLADKADYNYNLGALYFNRAVTVNDEMNLITGSSAADIKKYDALKAKRDEWFNKALPYLEKTVNTLDANAASLKGEDKKTYMNALVAAKEIYAKQNKLDKATEYKKKLEAVNK